MNIKQESLVTTQNRELSWLKFNERVLQEAFDKKVPLLERLKFIAIFMSNLDEFFMIRVGGLHQLEALDEPIIDLRSGMDLHQQLDAIYDYVRTLYKEKDQVYALVKKELEANNIYDLSYKELRDEERKKVDEIFIHEILPVLSPRIVDSLHPFPQLQNKAIYIAALLEKNGEEVLGLVPLPKTLEREIYLTKTKEKETRYIRMENVVHAHISQIFHNYKILETAVIRLTRNADLNYVDENFDIEEDYRLQIQNLIDNRTKLAPIRLEIHQNNGNNIRKHLGSKLELHKQQIYHSEMPLELTIAFKLINKIDHKKCKAMCYSNLQQSFCGELIKSEKISTQVEEKDVLLSHPYESMKPFHDLLKESCIDKQVVSIKMTIYRLDCESQIIDYLCQAAKNGKEVMILIELRARFDEQNNIDWSQKLEAAGCTIIYGFKEFKVHSKMCLITKKTKSGIHYITHIGTGNYNEATSKIYTDLSLITSNQQIGKDANTFFRNMGIANLEGEYSELMVAPNGMKTKIIDLIQEESTKRSKGKILIKINSLTDVDLIDNLKEASKNGCNITLIVRGICCLLPGVLGQTDNIKVVNVVGRFLEHSRIYIFGEGEAQKMYISSADFMTRNMQQRVEVACPIYQKDIQKKVLEIIGATLKDNVKASWLDTKGNYVRKELKDCEVPYESHEELLKGRDLYLR